MEIEDSRSLMARVVSRLNAFVLMVALLAADFAFLPDAVKTASPQTGSQAPHAWLTGGETPREPPASPLAAHASPGKAPTAPWGRRWNIRIELEESYDARDKLSSLVVPRGNVRLNLEGAFNDIAEPNFPKGLNARFGRGNLSGRVQIDLPGFAGSVYGPPALPFANIELVCKPLSLSLPLNYTIFIHPGRNEMFRQLQANETHNYPVLRRDCQFTMGDASSPRVWWKFPSPEYFQPATFFPFFWTGWIPQPQVYRREGNIFETRDDDLPLKNGTFVPTMQGLWEPDDTYPFSLNELPTNNPVWLTIYSILDPKLRLSVTLALQKPPIISIPGIGGTRLISGAHELWPGAFSGRSRLDLALNPDGETPARPGVNVRTRGILRSGIGTNVYGGFIDFMESQGYEEGEDLFTFPYDWRLDNTVHLSRLDDLIDEVLDESGAPQVILVAHSMGGLIGRAYILSGDVPGAKVDALITIGTPYLGSPKAYYALIMGYGFGNPFVSIDEMKQIAQNLPAAYQLLPIVPFVVDSKNGKELTLQETYSIRYKGFEQGTRTRNNTWSLNTQLLGEARDFHDEQFEDDGDPVALPAHVKHYVIVGFGIRTLAGYSLRDATPREQASHSFLELSSGRKVVLEPVFRDGDGTVPRWAYEMPTASKTFYVLYFGGLHTSEHGALTGNPSVQALVWELIREQTEGTGLKIPEPGAIYLAYPGSQALTEITEKTGLVFGKIDFILRSDAHLNVVDEATGDRLGFNEYGGTDESLGTGTFLAVEGTEYASIAVLSKTYRVIVNGINDGRFTLIIDTTLGNNTVMFHYPEVAVGNGTVAQSVITPSQATTTSPPSLALSADGRAATVPAKIGPIRPGDSDAGPAPGAVAWIGTSYVPYLLLALLGAVAATILIIWRKRGQTSSAEPLMRLYTDSGSAPEVGRARETSSCIPFTCSEGS